MKVQKKVCLLQLLNTQFSEANKTSHFNTFHIDLVAVNMTHNMIDMPGYEGGKGGYGLSEYVFSDIAPPSWNRRRMKCQ